MKETSILQLFLSTLRPNIRRAGKSFVSPATELQGFIFSVLDKTLSIVLPLQLGLNLLFLTLKADIKGSAKFIC